MELWKEEDNEERAEEIYDVETREEKNKRYWERKYGSRKKKMWDVGKCKIEIVEK